MSETVYQDVFDNQVALTDSVRATILEKHPEVNGFIDKIEGVLLTPDEVRQSIHESRSILYYRWLPDIMKGKWAVVVVRRIDRNYISTIYATDKVKSGEVVWKKTT